MFGLKDLEGWKVYGFVVEMSVNPVLRGNKGSLKSVITGVRWDCSYIVHMSTPLIDWWSGRTA